jgi:hypothetical protein
MPTFSLQQKHADLDHHNAQLILEVARDTGTTPITETKVLSLIGDEQQLRGIPAIGRGVQGCITGTAPGR